MSEQTPVIALVEDDAPFRKALARLLGLHQFETVPFETGDAFLVTPNPGAFDCILLDLHLPGGADGFEVLKSKQLSSSTVPTILMTAHDRPGQEERALRLGAVAYLRKPIDAERLLGAIRTATTSFDG